MKQVKQPMWVPARESDFDIGKLEKAWAEFEAART